MITMILCWVLYTKSIIGLALPILSTIGCGLYLILAIIKTAIRIHDIID